MNEQDLPEGEEALTPEEEAVDAKLQEAERQKRELEQAGWQWRETDGTRLLAHPANPDINVWFDPYTGEQLLSPKLVQRLKEDADRERQATAGQEWNPVA
ncbi:MAG: hypothetical protein HUU22_11030 [Phycisphaerae bacterium]|nr:hypothetical protein [Phycisphaerae bacterium]NUQ46556.1 hypothetical protein [Phycisphaerae bacterium]